MPGLEGTELSWSGVRCLSKSGVYLSALVWGCVAFSCQAPRCFRLIKPDVQGPRLKSLRGSCSDTKLIAPKSNQVRDPNRIAKPIHLTCIALHDSPQRTPYIPLSTQLRQPQAQQSGALGPGSVVPGVGQEGHQHPPRGSEASRVEALWVFTFRLGARDVGVRGMQLEATGSSLRILAVRGCL